MRLSPTAQVRKALVRCAAAITIGAAVVSALASPMPQHLGAILMQRINAPTPTLVIGGGTILDVGDGKAIVFGKDRCPRNEGIMAILFGTEPEQHTCIRLDRPHVPVTVADGGPRGPVDETWTVVQDGPRTSITRPNGMIVSQAR